MPDFKDYKAYAADARWARLYSEYQQRYAQSPRESDKQTAWLVLSSLREMGAPKRPRILDIGCSTGNFLRLLRHSLPDAELVGGDLMAPAVEECRATPDLAGIRFDVMDVFDLPTAEPFDVITANAVNVYFEPDEYRAALASISRALKPGGWFIAYEWVFPDNREQRIVEKSQGHPEGLKFWFRSTPFMSSAFEAAGFDRLEIEPFNIPIDLPKPEITGTDADLATYTVRDAETGFRHQYRGALYQPWAHISARKG